MTSEEAFEKCIQTLRGKYIFTHNSPTDEQERILDLSEAADALTFIKPPIDSFSGPLLTEVNYRNEFDERICARIIVSSFNWNTYRFNGIDWYVLYRSLYYNKWTTYPMRFLI